MGAITTITVADAAATPVDHDFIPKQIDGNVARYLEKSSSSPIGFWPLGVSLRETGGNNGNAKLYRARVTFDMPIVQTETIDGVDYPKLVRTYRASVDIAMPEDGTLQERKDFRKMLAEILDDSSVVDVLENLNNIY